MTLALLIGIPLVLILAYGFWMAGELGLGPGWRRSVSRRSRPVEDAGYEADGERTVPTDR